jgi:hypothetical protein
MHRGAKLVKAKVEVERDCRWQAAEQQRLQTPPAREAPRGHARAAGDDPGNPVDDLQLSDRPEMRGIDTARRRNPLANPL